MIARVGAEAAAALAAIHAEAFAHGWSTHEIAAQLANPAAFAFADVGGFVLAWAVAGEGEILTLAVRSAERRRGLGAALVAAAAAEARARGAAAMHLEVAEDNLPARALYAKLGFAEAGQRPGYYGGGEVNAIIMRRALPW